MVANSRKGNTEMLRYFLGAEYQGVALLILISEEPKDHPPYRMSYSFKLLIFPALHISPSLTHPRWLLFGFVDFRHCSQTSDR